MRNLNSATKYPSILTYHAILNGREHSEEKLVEFPDEPLFVSEKVDGLNCRIVIVPDMSVVSDRTGMGAFVGTREEFLWYSDDLIYNNAYGVVEHIRPFIPELLSVGWSQDIWVIWGELYGGRIGKAKHYTHSQQMGFRVFDVAHIPYEILKLTPHEISNWREGNNQSFISVDELVNFTQTLKLPLVQNICSISRDDLGSCAQNFELMQGFGESTFAGLDHTGPSEGYVVRTASRSAIAKLRFEYYRRTLM